MSGVRITSLILTFSFIILKGYSQQPSYRLINIRLVGINFKSKIENILRLQSYYEPAGLRLSISSQEELKVDSLSIPRINNSSEPNFLMLSLITNYQSRHNISGSNSLTIFCLPTQPSNPDFAAFNALGFAFIDNPNNGDNLILACVASSLGVTHKPDSTKFISDTNAIYVMRQAKINYSTDCSVFKNQEETGLMAYYIWNEDENGNIQFDANDPLAHINRSKKENFGIKYLKQDNWFFKPFAFLLKIKICPAHLIVLVASIIGFFLFIRFTKRFSKNKNWSLKFVVWIIRIFSMFFLIFINGFSFHLIDVYHASNYVLESQIVDFSQDVEISNIKSKVQDKLFFENDTTTNLSSQIFIKKKGEWYMRRNAPVLIFQLNKENQLKFKEGSNSLIYRNDTLVYRVQNHYVKIEYINDQNEITEERVFDYGGKEIFSTEFSKEKPGKRIVLFVNGYRSPFLSTNEFSRAVMLKRIVENKIEIERTNNKIYRTDIHGYWNHWNRFDDRFIEKLQPHHVFYVDGHHPIKTSNYSTHKIPFNLSLLNNLGDLTHFYFAASNYPSVCSDLNNHSCKYVSLPKFGVKKTSELLPTDLNYKGFKDRKESGIIAGKNLTQLLANHNLYSQSKDTLYIVCHSMGFAYSQGIIESLRGKINFGGYYIFCPENPSSGFVNPLEWKEVWQYGSNEKIEDCLQDGIAPQSGIRGLENNRIFFPKSLYPQLGFTGSHFIGNFTWVFDLKESQKGHITLR